MERLSIVLERIASELDQVASRLSRLTVSGGEAPTRALASCDLEAIQAIDHSEQVVRSLSGVITRLARDGEVCGFVDVALLSDGLSLEALKASLLGIRPVEQGTAGHLDLF